VRYAPSLRLARGDVERVRESHWRSLLARWPALDAVALEHTWGGVLGMTMNQGQFFGRLEEGLYAWAGCNGTGVAMGTASGTLLADYALGVDSDLVRDALGVRAAAWLPPDPFLGLGIGAQTTLLARRAGRER
jgi:glycine/D-amino acid oxidase-like deaminating enzyme